MRKSTACILDCMSIVIVVDVLYVVVNVRTQKGGDRSCGIIDLPDISDGIL